MYCISSNTTQFQAEAERKAAKKEKKKRKRKESGTSESEADPDEEYAVCFLLFSQSDFQRFPPHSHSCAILLACINAAFFVLS